MWSQPFACCFPGGERCLSVGPPRGAECGRAVVVWGRIESPSEGIREDYK